MIQMALDCITEDSEEESEEGLWINPSFFGGLHTLHPTCWISGLSILLGEIFILKLITKNKINYLN